jgi:outer membrane protein OmpA-like peptidoglycan-associated protein
VVEFTMKSILSIVLLLFAQNLLAQKTAKKQPKGNKFITSQFAESEDFADAMIDYEDYNTALKAFLLLEKQNPEDVLVKYKIGQSYLYKPDDHPKALKYLYQVKKLKPEILHIDFYLAKAFQLNYEPDSAIKYFSNYLTKNPNKSRENATNLYLKQCEVLKAALAQPSSYVVVNLDSNINTPYSEYAPVFLGSEKTLLFTFRGNEGIYKDRSKGFYPLAQYYENIYASNFVNNKWETAKRVEGPFNNKGHNASVSFTADNKSIYLYRNINDKSNGDIYSAKINDKKFENAIKVKNINSDNWEGSVTTNKDNSVIIFSSERKDGLGKRDLYIATKQKNGEWGTPKNIGDKINTTYNEDGPFLTEDGKKLYFSSDNQNAMGGYDVFVSDVISDTVFSEPKNLGYPINSVSDDIYVFVSPSDDKFYFSSSRAGSMGFMDIYYFLKSTHSLPVRHINLKATLLADSIPLGAPLRVYVKDAAGNILGLAGTFQTDKENGNTTIPLISSNDYVIDPENKIDPNYLKPIELSKIELTNSNVSNVVESEMNLHRVKSIVKQPVLSTADSLNLGYIKIKDDKNTSAINTSTTATSDNEMTAIEKQLKSANAQLAHLIYFDYDKSNLSKITKDKLNKFVIALGKSKNNANIKLNGYADYKGEDVYNKALSAKRNATIKNYLKAKGIKNIEINNLGEIDLNTNTFGVSENLFRYVCRRVEIEIIK